MTNFYFLPKFGAAETAPRGGAIKTGAKTKEYKSIKNNYKKF